jgi:hypothetical protein
MTCEQAWCSANLVPDSRGTGRLTRH